MVRFAANPIANTRGRRGDEQLGAALHVEHVRVPATPPSRGYRLVQGLAKAGRLFVWCFGAMQNSFAKYSVLSASFPA